MMPVAGQAPRATPADEWRQFRGSPQLRGVSASTLPATLKLLWTYESSDPIDSSAAIAGGVVYVGAGTGDLLALAGDRPIAIGECGQVPTPKILSEQPRWEWLREPAAPLCPFWEPTCRRVH
jgi:hypothetical protein